ncbi:MAG: sigma-54-dependent Fis family transcriptional regulator [Ignavibacteriaceae bacterium]|nr:sigma-54-dependent Fis family transcriptional regulator [Ignavibacteriaceae bacterium]
MSESEAKQTIEKKVQDYSAGFTSFLNEVNSSFPEKKEIKSLTANALKEFLVFTRELNQLLKNLSDLSPGTSEEVEKLKDEIKKLETLYSAGITFTSKSERTELLETAIDIVVKALNADTGFIMLSDEKGELESIYSKNSSISLNPDALRISTSIVKESLKSTGPIHLENIKDSAPLAQQRSIIQLGISSAICVPMISSSRVYGTVYLDRRNINDPFKGKDLKYLISFTNQIVKNLDLFSQIDSIKKRELADSVQKMEDIRNNFRSSEIVGSSKKIFDILRIASKVSKSDASIMLYGESGTGKNLIAKVIHNNSNRSRGPFYTVDCGSIPSELLESELFGYESGAFTGANKTKPGKLELADNGTLFLDEIGEMSLSLQPKLLRVIQTKEFERLGGTTPIKINVRIIGATNKNLTELVEKGAFREDLFYRLKVIEMVVPPLRERREDISDLVDFFTAHHSSEKKFTVSHEALLALESYDWPGNIRELENVILRCIVLAQGNVIGLEELPPEIVSDLAPLETVNSVKTLSEAEDDFRRMYIMKILKKTQSKAEAAQLLGVNRTHFYKILNQLGIDA